LQNTFIEVYQKLHDFQFESSLGSWIKRIAVNKCIDHLRKKKRLAEDLMGDFTVERADDFDDEVEYNVRSIIDMLESLPEGYRVVFSLYAVEGYDHEEVG